MQTVIITKEEYAELIAIRERVNTLARLFNGESVYIPFKDVCTILDIGTGTEGKSNG